MTSGRVINNVNIIFYIPENTYVCPGEIIDIPHYGQVKQFCVTSVQGDHGSFEVLNHDHFNESLVQDFASLNMSDDISCNISKYNVTSKSDDLRISNVNNVDETNLSDSNISTYYSFSNQSIGQDTCDDYVCSSAGDSDAMFTSTPVKADQKSTSTRHNITCCRCSAATVSYYITAAATKIVVNQSDDSKSTFRHNFKEKLIYDLVGGLDKQIQMLKEMVELSVKSPDVFQSYGE